MQTLSRTQILRRSVVSTLLTFILALSVGVTVVGNDWTSWGLSSQVGGLPAQPVAAAEFNGSIYLFNNRLLSDGSSFIEMALLSHICAGPSCIVPNWLALGEVPGSRTPLTASAPSATAFNNRLYLLRSVTGFAGPVQVNRIELAAMDGSSIWSNWQQLPAPNFDLPASVADARPALVAFGNRLYVFVSDDDGGIRMTSCSVTSCPPGPSIWTAWQEVLVGDTRPSSPAAAVFNNQLYLLVVRSNNVWMNVMGSGESWSGWSTIGAFADSGLAAVTFNNQLHVIIWANGSIQIITLSTGMWSSARSVSPVGFATAPPAAAPLGGILYVFAVSNFDLMFHRETGAPTPEPGTSEISIRVDRGCGPTGTSYSFGSPITIFYRVNEAGTAVLYDFDPAGTLKPISLGLIPAGVEPSLTATIAASLGVETIVLQVTTVSGRVLAAPCSFSIGGVSTTLVQITTNKGCETTFAAGESFTASYSVSVPVTRVRIFNIVPGSGAVLLTPTPLTTPTGSVSGTVGPQRGDRVLIVVPVTPSMGIISATCRYRVP